MKKTRVFINGFGRIGRAALRIMIEDESIVVVGINDIYDREQMGRLFAYDSVYGSSAHSIEVVDNQLVIDKQAISLFQEKDPRNLNLDGVDVLLQCTGIFLGKEENAIYLENGAKTVVISAPANADIPTFIMDVNHQYYQGERIISNSSCSANAIVPIFSVLDEAYSVKSGSMSMFHSYTAYQSLLDVKHYSKDIRRTRSATQNIQPLVSSAQKATELFFPHLRDKLTAKSIRIPLPATTLYDITLKLDKSTDADSINKLFFDKSNMQFKNMLDITKELLVSSDFIGNPYAAVIDASLTQIIGGNLVKIMAWQDNEYGYAMQLTRMVKVVS